MRTEFIAIGPEQATKWVTEAKGRQEDGRFRQRSVSQATVDRYAADMRAGNWLETHQGIAFDEDGNLIDGQHRLLAIIKAGVVIRMAVTFDVPKKKGRLFAMDVIDTGKVRSVAHQLHLMHGIKNANFVSATTYVLCGMASGLIRRGGYKHTIANALLALRIWGESVETLMGGSEDPKKLTGAIFAPIVLYHNLHPRRGQEFLEKLVNLENLQRGHPALLLHKWRGRHRTQGGADRFSHAEVTTAALFHFHENNDIKRLQVSKEATAWMSRQQLNNFEKVRKAVNEEEV